MTTNGVNGVNGTNGVNGVTRLPVAREPRDVYLFGYPISHSLAPLLHNTLFHELGVPWTYSLLESKDTTECLTKMKSPRTVALAVTMPHKQTFMSQVDEVTEEGRIVGAINTVFVREALASPAEHGLRNGAEVAVAAGRQYIGTNTDTIGIRESFIQAYPGISVEANGQPAMIIGGGGACRAAVYALFKWLGASKIYFVNRFASEVEDIATDFVKSGFVSSDRMVHLSTVEQARNLALSAPPLLVVGTVPDFPPQTVEEKLARQIAEVMLDESERKGYVLEMCYKPVITQLYRICEGFGWKVIKGTDAMIHQGVAQQVLWTGIPLEKFPVEKVKALIEEAVSNAH